MGQPGNIPGWPFYLACKMDCPTGRDCPLRFVRQGWGHAAGLTIFGGKYMGQIKIEMRPLQALHPYENNPRYNEDAIESVAKSIREYGFKVPMVITSEGEIVCGHTRYKATTSLGLEEVPCVIADDLTPEQIRAFRLADNKVKYRTYPSGIIKSFSLSWMRLMEIYSQDLLRVRFSGAIFRNWICAAL